jgi:predicted dehydrogenase
MQWLFGLPKSVRAFCEFGKWHDIEVEDSVTAYFTYPNGATGVFITTTGEAPGTNRLEVCGEMGKIVVENGTITWTRNTMGQSEFSRTKETSFGRPDVWTIDIPANGHGGQHVTLLQDFVDAILTGKKLMAPAEEGIKSVMMANAMVYSSLKDKTVELPLDGAEYEKLLKKLIKGSKLKKGEVKETTSDDFQQSVIK